MSKILDLKLKTPTDSELIEGSNIVLNALGETDLSRFDTMGVFCIAMKENELAHFIVAKTKKKIIGMGAIFLYRSLAWIGVMGVEVFFQRKGVGKEIIKHLLSYAQDRDIKTIKLDATDKGRGLYQKHGFKEEYPVSMYKINAIGDKNKPVDTCDLEISEELPVWLLNLDKKAFGGDRSSFLRFQHKQGKTIIADNLGYGMVIGDRVGPVIAENVDIAIKIVKYAYHLEARKIYVPHHEALSAKFISSLSLKWKEQTRCTRMILGEKINEDINRLYASYSFATG